MDVVWNPFSKKGGGLSDDILAIVFHSSFFISLNDCSKYSLSDRSSSPINPLIETEVPVR